MKIGYSPNLQRLIECAKKELTFCEEEVERLKHFIAECEKNQRIRSRA